VAQWKCLVCGYIYDEAAGEPATQTPPGTPFESLPADWRCPVCQAGKESFVRIEAEEVRTDAATTVSDVIISELQAWGITLVFGMPGASALGLFDAIRRNPAMRYIGIRHEGNGAMAASAYHKLTGKMAVCLTIAGPGATNLATGLYDAKEDRASVISLNGQVAVQYEGPGGFQETDQDAFFRPITVYNNTIYDRTKAVNIITRALKHAIIERGVSQVSVPGNVQRMALDTRFCARETCLSNFNIHPEEKEMAWVVKLIDNAQRPAIVAGWGAYTEGRTVLELARRIKAPIVTTLRAKGILPYDTEWLVGIHGSLGTPHAHEIVKNSDLLVCCGVGFSQQTELPGDKPLIQIDLDPLKLGINPLAVSLWGNCGVVLPELLERVQEKRNDSVLPEVTRMKRAWDEQLEREADPDAVPIRPPYIMKVLEETIPDDCIISIDVGENGWWFGRNFKMKQQRFVMSGYLGTMGFGFPGAIAAKLAYPDRTVVCITGDGGFSMAMGDFVTAVKYDLPMAVILLNNHDLAMIRVEQKMDNYPSFATDLFNPDYAAFAEGSGGKGIRVERPEELEPAVREALRAKLPTIIDVETDPVRFP
jgi:pyruvate oxidase